MVRSTGLFAILMLVIIPEVHGDDCKDYKLTAADQSLVDMVKHYLHTSRKEECPKSIKDSETHITYIRWGRQSCPKGAELVYTGQAGGNMYTNKGGGVNYLCLPNTPEQGKPQSYANDQLYGAEYEVNASNKPNGWPSTLYQKEVPCAVCSRRQRSTLLMIPDGCQTSSRKSCFKDWNMEYNGYLMSDHYTHNRRDYACVDMNPEPLNGSDTTNSNGALFYPIRTICGSLKCPPYKDKTDVYCVVCSK